jgi:hypothetical protein
MHPTQFARQCIAHSTEVNTRWIRAKPTLLLAKIWA